MQLEEMPINQNLSGHAYLAVTMRKPENPDDLKMGKVVIRKPGNCNHVAFICTVCAPTWNWDYKLMFDRTAGGRALKARLPEGWENGRIPD